MEESVRGADARVRSRRRRTAAALARIGVPSLLTTVAVAGATFATPAGAVRPQQLALHSGRVTLKLSRRAYAALTDSSGGSFPETRSLTATGQAAAGAAGVFRFPLTRGRVDPAELTGTANSIGGIRFAAVRQNPTAGQSSTVQFTLTSFTIDLSSTPPELTATFLGQATDHDVPIASLVTTGARARTTGREVMLSGFGLKLLAAGGQLFNQQAYNDQSHGFKVGQVVGTVTVDGVR